MAAGVEGEVLGNASDVTEDPDPEEVERASRELAVLSTRAAPLASKLATGDALEVADLVARRDIIKAAMAQAMVEGVHYGRIEGVSKPFLAKPGAEALGVLFKFAPTFPDARMHVTMHPDGHMDARCTCELVHFPTGIVVAEGVGMCSTREAKYMWRDQQRTCPVCSQPAVRFGKRDEGPDEWYCWRKISGCGAKFQVGTPEADGIAAQVVGRIVNPDLADSYNTVLKQASKRAYVDATLHATGASDLFTQDLDDKAVAGAGTPFQGSTGNEPTPQQQPQAQPAQQQPADEFAGMKSMALLGWLAEHHPAWDWRRMLVRAANRPYPTVQSFAALGQLPPAGQEDVTARLRTVVRLVAAAATVVDETKVRAVWAQAFDGHAIDALVQPSGPPVPPASQQQLPPLPTDAEVEAGAHAGAAAAEALRVPTKDEYELAVQVLANPTGYGANEAMVAHAEGVKVAYEAEQGLQDIQL